MQRSSPSGVLFSFANLGRAVPSNFHTLRLACLSHIKSPVQAPATAARHLPDGVWLPCAKLKPERVGKYQAVHSLAGWSP